MSWKEPFEQRWPEPVDDIRRRFDAVVPSFSVRELAVLTGVLVLLMGLVVLLLEVSTL